MIVIKIYNSCYGGHRDCPLRTPTFVATVCERDKMKQRKKCLDDRSGNVGNRVKSLSDNSQRKYVEKKHQLDVTECFIALIICSTCFGHLYAHHQKLETICVLLPPMVCIAWLLVVGGQVQGSRLCFRDEGCCSTQSSNIPHPESIADCPASDLQQPTNKASRTIGSNNTLIVSSS